MSPDAEGQANDPAASWGTPEALMALYNAETADELPAAAILSPGRRKKAEMYLKMFPDIEFWRQAFRESRRSKFLRGECASPDGHSWRATFDWYLSRGKADGTENVVKTHEGHYRDPKRRS